MASDTQQILSTHKELLGCFDAEDHDACDFHAEGCESGLRAWELDV